MAPLPFPRPAAIVAPLHASACARDIAGLALTLDAAQRALRDLEDHARGVPGVLAARIHACAAEAAGVVEAHGYDLFLAVNTGGTAGEGTHEEAGQ